MMSEPRLCGQARFHGQHNYRMTASSKVEFCPGNRHVDADAAMSVGNGFVGAAVNEFSASLSDMPESELFGHKNLRWSAADQLDVLQFLVRFTGGTEAQRETRASLAVALMECYPPVLVAYAMAVDPEATEDRLLADIYHQVEVLHEYFEDKGV